MTIQKFGPKSLVTAVGLQKFDKSQANSAPTFYAIWVSLSLKSLGSLRSKFGSLRSKFGSLRSKFGESDSKFGCLRSKFGESDSKFDNSDSKFDVFSAKVWGFPAGKFDVEFELER
jgi:hypothetical protein